MEVTMPSTKREIPCYDYVNHPYERVRDALRQDTLSVFQAATKSAVSRARSVAAELGVEVGGVAIKADIKVRVKSIEEKVDAIPAPTTRLQVEWEAASMPGLFPVMDAELSSTRSPLPRPSWIYWAITSRHLACWGRP
jgi:hypothetical protein